MLAKEDALMHCHGPSFTHFLHLLRLSEGRTKKSPRSSMLNKMNTNHTNLSRKSKLGASLAFRPVFFRSQCKSLRPTLAIITVHSNFQVKLSNFPAICLENTYDTPHVDLFCPCLESPRSRTSLGTVSSTAEVRTTESTTAEEQRSNVKQSKVTLRRKRLGCEDLMALDHSQITGALVGTC